ncbi:hypothetical protein DLM75_18420 [Leptospira stimsonii]|uniref:Uncharacterized protein n=1 Tax=Leptospira stimsonii TaxID=2202203 RepID=A0A396Z099_9LEPT|nr:hypothetical protein DLM75_18420 [Leptospira stimsonii]
MISLDSPRISISLFVLSKTEFFVVYEVRQRKVIPLFVRKKNLERIGIEKSRCAFIAFERWHSDRSTNAIESSKITV